MSTDGPVVEGWVDSDGESVLQRYAKVSKVGGDYTFDGVVVGRFHKLSGKIRYVVEDDRGILHIFNRKQLKARA